LITFYQSHFAAMTWVLELYQLHDGVGFFVLIQFGIQLPGILKMPGNFLTDSK
jgi:hypothetical protein